MFDGSTGLTSLKLMVHTLMPRPGCKPPGCQFIAWSRLEPRLDRSKVSTLPLHHPVGPNIYRICTISITTLDRGLSPSTSFPYVLHMRRGPMRRVNPQLSFIDYMVNGTNNAFIYCSSFIVLLISHQPRAKHPLFKWTPSADTAWTDIFTYN